MASLGKKTEEQAAFISVIKEAIELAAEIFILCILRSNCSAETSESEDNTMLQMGPKMLNIQEYLANEYGCRFSCEMLKHPRMVRMHPPIPLLLPRECHDRCAIDGYEIPAKTRVMVNAWALGRDPEYWKEAESFKPERYLDINAADYKGNNFEYIPFGAGRRICPGMSFGLANIELPLAMFLYHFDWLLPEGMKPERVDMTETFGVTARRKYPLYVIPIVGRPLPVP
ncbi:cytochrome [Sesamum angolense]|uniref:Cytochrome n=1 Tax=Sesamum angolense TaxID=2727404 RepID=A0AAE2BIU4_9LAMI|nr:cytochrome [Sesamum angolense]